VNLADAVNLAADEKAPHPLVGRQRTIYVVGGQFGEHPLERGLLDGASLLVGGPRSKRRIMVLPLAAQKGVSYACLLCRQHFGIYNDLRFRSSTLDLSAMRHVRTSEGRVDMTYEICARNSKAQRLKVKRIKLMEYDQYVLQ